MKYFDGDLNDLEAVRFKQHLKVCPGCNESFNEMSEVLNFIQNNEIEPPRDFENQVMDKIYSLEVKRKKKYDRLFSTFYSIAGFLLLLTAGLLIVGLSDISIANMIHQAKSTLDSVLGSFFAGLSVYEFIQSNPWVGIAFLTTSVITNSFFLLTGFLGLMYRYRDRIKASPEESLN